METVPGTRFRHVVLAPAVQPEGEVVHLYIDGDGRPFVDARRVAADPTPRRSQVVRWMLKDSAPRYYLGRPCYLGLAGEDGCGPRWWTTERYSEAVVESMVAAATGLLEGRPVLLIGYSGGGTLAVHMAGRMENVRGVITVGANLDVAAWTAHHGYTPLDMPLEPEAALARLDGIPQLHLLGERDEVVPVPLVRRLVPWAPVGAFCVLPGFRHDCCWTETWTVLLAQAQTWSCAAAGGKALRGE